MSQLDHRRFSRGGRIVTKSDQFKLPTVGNGVNLTKPLNATAPEFVPGSFLIQKDLTPVLKATAPEFIPGSFVPSKESKIELKASAKEFVPHKYDSVSFSPLYTTPHPTVYSSRNHRYPQDHSNGHDIEFESAILPTSHGVAIPIRLPTNGHHHSVHSSVVKSSQTPLASNDKLEVKVTSEEPTNTLNETIPGEDDKPEEDSNDSNSNTTTTENSDVEPQESDSSDHNPQDMTVAEESSIVQEINDEIVNEEVHEDENEYDNDEPLETEVSAEANQKGRASPKRNIKYDDGSYNPQSPLREKKMYTKNFLLQFKELCNEKPQTMHSLPDITPDPESKSKKNTPRRRGNLKNSKDRKELTSSSKGKIKPVAVRKPILKEENSKDDIAYKIQSILNKLTPNTYDKLFEQLKEIDISIESNMDLFIGIIFPKAVSEYRYCELYAKLCADMVKSLGTEPMKLFRKLLLSRCQREFENKPTAPELPPDSSEAAKIENEEKATKIRLYNLGNIKFIGELFKLQMLRESIMFYCIDSLLKTKTETDLEHMCLLITTIGKLLDKGDALNKVFERIKTLSQDNTIVSRIKYMLMDIIDLRAKRWIPRREVEGPKTIKEVHDETDRKEKEKQLKSKERESDFTTSRRIRDSKMSPSIKSLETPHKGTQAIYSKGSKNMIDTKDKDAWIPTRSRGRPNITSPSRSNKKEGDSFNKFALLSDDSPKQQAKPHKGKSFATEVAPQEPVTPVTPIVATPTTVKKLTEQEIREKTESLLSDYFEEECTEDAVYRLKSYLDSPTAATIMVNTVLSFSYEKKDQQRKLCAELLTELKEFIEVSLYEKVFDEVMQLLPDLCYDIPKAAEYTGFFLAEGVKSGFINQDYLTPEKLKDASISPVMSESLLTTYFKILLQKDTELAKKAYKPFEDTIQNFLKDKNKERFLQANNFAVIEQPEEQPEEQSPESYQEPEPEVESEPSQEEQDPEPEIDEEPQTEVDEEPQTEVDEEPQTEVDEEPQTEVDEEPQPEVDEEPQPEVDEEPQPEVDEEPHPETEQEVEQFEPEVEQTESEPQPESEQDHHEQEIVEQFKPEVEQTESEPQPEQESQIDESPETTNEPEESSKPPVSKHKKPNTKKSQNYRPKPKKNNKKKNKKKH